MHGVAKRRWVFCALRTHLGLALGLGRCVQSQEKAPGFRVEPMKVCARAGEGSWRAQGAGGREQVRWVGVVAVPCVCLRLLLLQLCCHRSCARRVCSPAREPGLAGWVSNLPSSHCGALKPLLGLLGASCIQGADIIPARAGDRAVEHLPGHCS